MKRRNKLILSLFIMVVISTLASVTLYSLRFGIPVSQKSVDIENISFDEYTVSFDIVVARQSDFWKCMKGYIIDINEKENAIVCRVYKKPWFLIDEKSEGEYSFSFSRQELRRDNIEAIYYGKILIWNGE